MSLDLMETLRSDTRDVRLALVRHPIYSMINTVERLAIFMERHVFAVWDFMSLLKTLQRSLTCIRVPWTPTTGTNTTRFINDIVLGEESDEDGQGGYISHFELYREAMGESGASTASIDALVRGIHEGAEPMEALVECDAPAGVAEFVRTTWSFIGTGNPHEIAAAFTLGREDIIPDMFRKFVQTLDRESGGRYSKTNYYLLRHIEVDEQSHAPLAVKMMHELCGTDLRKWQEATEAARVALTARIRLWDAIADAMPETGEPIGSEREASNFDELATVRI